MKKGAKVLLCVFFASICFLVGMFVGRNVKDDYAILPQNHITDLTSNTVDQDFRLDINSATKLQLMELEGIGETLAERIIAYREQYGPFVKADDLLNVEGIGEIKLQAINEWIKVGE